MSDQQTEKSLDTEMRRQDILRITPQQIEKALDTEMRRQNILSITPEGWDPLVYWHTVAQDAMHSRDATEKRRVDMLSDYDRLKQYEKDEHKRSELEQAQRTFPSVRELLNRVQDGDFSMNIQFSFYPNITKGE